MEIILKVDKKDEHYVEQLKGIFDRHTNEAACWAAIKRIYDSEKEYQENQKLFLSHIDELKKIVADFTTAQEAKDDKEIKKMSKKFLDYMQSFHESIMDLEDQQTDRYFFNQGIP